MLSISNITSAKDALNYYTADKYYTNGQKVVDKSEWWGRGVDRLDLKGPISREDLGRLLDGQLPSGQQLGKKIDGNIQHRPGLDLTFSAPKSVSILSEVAGDKRIHKAHSNAVKKALAFMQDRAMQTRVKEDGKLVAKNVDNLTAALFQENTSRNNDPQLHTHCVILNMVQRPDGEWRSVTNEQLYWNKMVAGAIYRAELAFHLQKLGYEIDSYKSAMFEVKGIPTEVIEKFSSRREEIEAAILKYGYQGAYGAGQAALRTRSSKQHVQQSILDEKWQSICRDLRFYPKRHIAKEPDKQLSETKLKELAKEAVKYGAKAISEREAVFTVDELKREALSFGLGYLSPDRIDRAIQNSVHTGFLVKNDQTNNIQSRVESNAPLITTKEMLLKEANIKQLMWQGKNSQQPLLETARATEALSELCLNEGQASAAKLILTSKDRVVGVQGYAGTGKTTMLNAIRKIMDAKASNSIVGLSPSAASAEELQK